jgi:hypothetical protein
MIVKKIIRAITTCIAITTNIMPEVLSLLLLISAFMVVAVQTSSLLSKFSSPKHHLEPQSILRPPRPPVAVSKFNSWRIVELRGMVLHAVHPIETQKNNKKTPRAMKQQQMQVCCCGAPNNQPE